MNVSGVASQIQPQQVTASALKTASNDGDGRTGVAALNDGDAAAQSAARQVHSSSYAVDVKA
jgi:hypothetical protein